MNLRSNVLSIFVMLMLCVLCFDVMAFGFGGNRMKGKMKERNEETKKELIQKLELTSEQLVQFEQAEKEQQESREKIKEVMKNGELERYEVVNKMNDLQADLRKKLAEFLTEEQLGKYDQFVKEQKQNKGNRSKGRGMKGFGS